MEYIQTPIRFVITDLDGSLLTDAKEISPDFWPLQQQLKDRQILFAVASGRQYQNLYNQFMSIADNTVFFAENGTLVVFRGEILFVNPLDLSLARDLVRVGRKLTDAFTVLCGQKSAYIESKDPHFVGEISQYFQHLEQVDDLCAVDDVILKVSICDFVSSATNSYQYFQPLESICKVAVSGTMWLDITDLKANKGIAIRQVQQLMNISVAETMAFGDYLNDLEMMETAAYSFAMRNAHPDILAASAYVTAFDNNAHGVVRTIAQYCLV
jgi:Cof subfamily protein (haloacid dehalogenase superfamily)